MLVAAGIHAVMAAPIVWVKEEPYKLQVLLASTLRGAIVGFMLGLTIHSGHGWLDPAVKGAVYGLLTGLVVWLAGGGWASKSKPFILISSIVTGAITGTVLSFF